MVTKNKKNNLMWLVDLAVPDHLSELVIGILSWILQYMFMNSLKDVLYMKATLDCKQCEMVMPSTPLTATTPSLYNTQSEIPQESKLLAKETENLPKHFQVDVPRFNTLILPSTKGLGEGGGGLGHWWRGIFLLTIVGVGNNL